MGNHVGGGLSVLAESMSFLEMKSEKADAAGASTSASTETPTSGSSGEEKPCGACTDFKTWAKFQSQQKREAKGGTEGAPPTKEEEGADPIFDALMAKRNHMQCPLDKDELGRSSWGFLHTMAAYFPDNPDPAQQKEMSVFIKIFAKYYPCEHCAKDFRKSIRDSPPKTLSRTDFSMWLCRQHNEVNRKIGKPEFDCRRVDERWKDGWSDGSCDF